MFKPCALAVLVLLVGLPLSARAAEDSGSPAERYAALVHEYDDAAAAHAVAVAAAKTPEARREADALRRGPEQFTHLFQRIWREHPKDPAGLDALVWVLAHDANGPEGDEALRVVPRDHAASDKLGSACVSVAQMTQETAERFLRDIAEHNPHRQVKAKALYGLAVVLKRWADTAPLLEPPDRESARAWASYLGPSVTGRIRRNRAALSGEAERLFERLRDEFGNVVYDDAEGLTVGEGAALALHEIRDLAVGRRAPDLAGDDLDRRAMRLSDFKGRVVVVSFWASWCPPCMQLIPHERALAAKLSDRPFTLLGVSGDEDRDGAAKIARDAGVTWRSWWDGGKEGKLATAWNVRGWPTVYVIDREGTIRNKWFGAPDPAALEEAVDTLLK
jgi:peroxiredoxin